MGGVNCHKGSKKDGGLSAKVTLSKLKKRIINRYGIVKIPNDGSMSFNGVFKQYMEDNHIKLKTSESYKHDTLIEWLNGSSE
jgi:hypothetical protein